MSKNVKPSKLNEPLTKADFYLYQLDKHIGIYTAVCGIFFVLGIVTAGGAIYDFLSGGKYYGLDKAVYSVLCFSLARGAFRKFDELRDEQQRIQAETLKNNE